MAHGRKPPPTAEPPKPAQRAHKPHELGPRVYQRGRWYGADLRPWGGDRCTLRNPAAPGWPARGDRTDDVEVAERWKWKYVDHHRDSTKRKQLGLAPKPRAIGERVDAYLVHRARSMEDRTAVADGTALRTHLLPAVGASRRVDTIDTDMVQGIVDRMLDDGYAHSTVYRFVASWSHFFVWLGRKDDDNPAQRVVLPKAASTDVVAFTDAQLVAVRRAADKVDASRVDRRENRCNSIRLAVELGLATGGRQKELMALEWPAFKPNDRTVRFTQQITHDRRGVKPLKGKVARTSLILPSWWDYHRDRARGRVLTWADGLPDVSTAYMQIQLVYDLAKVNGPGVGWHTLRHTYARHFLELGGRLEELQKSLGHTSIKTTEKYYVHFTPETAAQLARGRIYGEVGPRLVGKRRTA